MCTLSTVTDLCGSASSPAVVKAADAAALQNEEILERGSALLFYILSVWGWPKGYTFINIVCFHAANHLMNIHLAQRHLLYVSFSFGTALLKVTAFICDGQLSISICLSLLADTSCTHQRLCPNYLTERPSSVRGSIRPGLSVHFLVPVFGLDS